MLRFFSFYSLQSCKFLSIPPQSSTEVERVDARNAKSSGRAKRINGSKMENIHTHRQGLSILCYCNAEKVRISFFTCLCSPCRLLCKKRVKTNKIKGGKYKKTNLRCVYTHTNRVDQHGNLSAFGEYKIFIPTKMNNCAEQTDWVFTIFS